LYIINGTAATQGRTRATVHPLPVQQPLGRAQVPLPLSRKYIASNYDAIRDSTTRITVRECENSPPIAIATFNYGVERTIDLRKLGAKEIDEAIAELEGYSQHLSKTIKI
jgi:hypothetical protein